MLSAVSLFSVFIQIGNSEVKVILQKHSRIPTNLKINSYLLNLMHQNATPTKEWRYKNYISIFMSIIHDYSYRVSLKKFRFSIKILYVRQVYFSLLHEIGHIGHWTRHMKRYDFGLEL